MAQGFLAKLFGSRAPATPAAVLVVATDAAPAPTRAGSDGLQNVVAGLGTSRDKRYFSEYGAVLAQDPARLEDMYRGSWLAGRIVDTVADDMTRAWVSLTWDDYDSEAGEGGRKAIEAAEKAFELKAKTNAAGTWGRLYGGAAIIILTRGEDPSTPLVLENVTDGDLLALQVVDRTEISASGAPENNIESPNYRMPTSYLVAETGHTVHWSRVVRFNGRAIPRRAWLSNGMWDDSELQAPVDAIKNYDTGENGAASMIWEANVDIFKMVGLAKLLATKDGSAKVTERLQLAATIKSFNRTLVMDNGPGGADQKGDDYDQKTTRFTGLTDVIEKLMVAVCGAADIPMTRLFGQSPGGLNATGDSDLRNYYDHVAARQETNLRPQLERLYEVLVRSTLGKMPDGFTIKFNPLWQMSEKETAEIDKLRAERDNIYWTIGAVNEGVIARELLDKRTYKTLEEEDVALAEELALQPDPVPPALPAVPANGAPKPPVPTPPT